MDELEEKKDNILNLQNIRKAYSTTTDINEFKKSKSDGTIYIASNNNFVMKKNKINLLNLLFSKFNSYSNIYKLTYVNFYSSRIYNDINRVYSTRVSSIYILNNISKYYD